MFNRENTQLSAEAPKVWLPLITLLLALLFSFTRLNQSGKSKLVDRGVVLTCNIPGRYTRDVAIVRMESQGDRRARMNNCKPGIPVEVFFKQGLFGWSSYHEAIRTR